MNNIPLVSVIIPMYNAEKYITSCIQSVEKQTLTDIEIICIDDCSTDTTYNIVNNLAQADKRIKLLQLPINSGGASQPRNIGMQFSRGKYIAFLDSDDLYTFTALSELVNIAERYDADVVHTEQVYQPKENVINIDESTELITFSKENVNEFCKQPIIETTNLHEKINLFYQNKFFGWVHNKLYKRDFLTINNLQFDDLLVSEDIVFYFKVICKAKRIVRVPNIVYIYRHNPNSITRKEVPIEQSVHALMQLMIKGSEIIDKFLETLPLTNLQDRLLPIDYLIQQHLIWTQRFYNQYSISDLEMIMRNEISKYCNQYIPFFTYLWHTIHNYRQKILKNIEGNL